MRLIIASNNGHKIREFREILPTCEIVSPRELGVDFDHEETGITFYDNALGKARSLQSLLIRGGADPAECTVLADDSGLVIPALGGAPGIYSARYGWNEKHPPADDQDRNILLLKNMAGIRDRRAYYVCCMAMVSDTDRLVCVQETWNGEIAEKQSSGTGGFGYDPLFWLAERQCTVAELEPGVKETLSHRAKAIKSLIPLLENR